MKLAPRIYLVASGDLGFGLTDSYDCHAYVVDGGGELALIDTGCGRDPAAILEVMEQDGLDPRRISRILLTHAHADHAGGARSLREATGARVLVHEYWADTLASGDEAAIGLEAARTAGVYPPDYRFPACTVDGTLRGGERLTVGDLLLTALDTPGHSQGHLSFLANGPGLSALFAGDLVFHGGRVARLPDSSQEQFRASFERVAAQEVDGLYPGHMAVVIHRAGQHIQAGAAALRRGDMPPSIV